MFTYQFRIYLKKVFGIGFVQNLQRPPGNFQNEFFATNSINIPVVIRGKNKK